MSPEAEAILKSLALLPTATFEDVERKYKEIAKVVHPDAGGDEKAMLYLNASRRGTGSRSC